MGNLTVNGVNVNAMHIRELQEGVNQNQLAKAIDGDGLDSLVYKDPENGKFYIAYGDNMDFSSLQNRGPGDRTHATLNGKAVEVKLFENEVNNFGEGAMEALKLGKTVAVGAGKFAANNGLEIVGAGMTLGMFARMGGAKVASTAGQSFMSKVGTWAFGPAKDLTVQAGKGFGKAAAYGAAAVVVTAAVGTVGYGIYGEARKQDDTRIKSITK
ncbi:MAG: hypothetical protein IV090_16510 [Candidatus Sericytochromatia bacterium]|nr:hypothetical protein [Candidatus Sericytochromatia bacterium]